MLPLAEEGAGASGVSSSCMPTTSAVMPAGRPYLMATKTPPSRGMDQHAGDADVQPAPRIVQPGRAQVSRANTVISPMDQK